MAQNVNPLLEQQSGHKSSDDSRSLSNDNHAVTKRYEFFLINFNSYPMYCGFCRADCTKN